ncbi:KPN_02809 family neutral zinc metallopeptidase [Advenella alkanexedens]|uniref:KPN_02809 family neutral zinc metallopeptidase n=1 Tax=Advenella alkanexedens TaxID=1481665 RepID=UPI002676A0B5|nr:neutral zinc metallopeptidase [Advenella alkanexedens]WKU19934.1 neutral zinc metallopeptidase [Advenella alkanexedens]
MRLDGSDESKNIEDRRGSHTGMGGGMFGRGGGGKKFGLGTIVLILVAMYFGVDPNLLLQMTGSDAPSQYEETTYSQGSTPGISDTESRFVAKVLKTTEDAWGRIFQQQQWGAYPEPKLVLYSGSTRSACGLGQATMGPFYCPADEKVYLDLSFFREMGQRLGAHGDFAQGYVIAHEIGHHVQNRLGILDQVNEARSRGNQRQANAISVLSELQADCLAGIWANQLRRQGDIIEPGDIEEAINAAAAVGDDRLQKQQQGYVVPDAFTHGTSQQRMTWFKRGLESGNIAQCDTFASTR